MHEAEPQTSQLAIDDVQSASRETVQTTRFPIDAAREIVRRIISVDGVPESKNFVWPSTFSAKDALRATITAVSQHPETEAWPSQVLVFEGNEGLEFISVEEYEALEESESPSTSMGAVRLNLGPDREYWPDPDSPVGLSITAYNEDDQEWLSLNLGVDQDHQARSIMEATIIPEGGDRVAAVFD